MANSVGVIDPGYTGEVIVKFKPTPYFISDKELDNEYEIGDRIAQLIITKNEDIQFEIVESLEKSDRGSNGFGSSDKVYV